MMQRIRALKVITKTMICLAAVAALGCAKDDQDKKISSGAAGGVDGSGGLLPFLDEAGFDDWIKTEHQYMVRDVIHHLEMIRENSPEDFKYVPKDMPARFLMEKKGDLQKLADSLTYFTVSGSCTSANHGPSDASVTPDGRVCFSYRAFRNLAVRDAIPKLLSMTMHEISHLRGFEEADAVQWQLRFDVNERIGGATMLHWNENHKRSRETLKKVSQKVVDAMQTFLRRDGSENYACAYLSQASDRGLDLTMSGQSLPEYLQRASYSIVGKIGAVENHCMENKGKGTAELLAPILRDIADLTRKFERYESPICTGELCAGTRFISYAPEEALLEWEAKKDNFRRGKDYPLAKQEKASCSLLDLTDRKSVPLVKDENGTFDLRKLYPNPGKGYSAGLWGLDFTSGSRDSEENRSVVIVELSHGGAIQILESSGFNAGPFANRGVLVPKTLNKISMRFALMDPKQRARELRPGEFMAPNDIPYSSRDPYFFSIRHAPTVIREFQLDCKLED